MNFFFNTGRASRASQNNQDTAFFQAGQASKTSIFDNQQPSETQYAYELFNQESKQQNNKQKSIISKLDQFNRESDFVQLPNNSHQSHNQSSDQNESKMTFGMKLSNKLYESNVGQSKPKTFKFLLQKKLSGMKNDQGNTNIVKINKEYSSNFSLKIDSYERPIQMESVPVQIKGSKNKGFQTSSSMSSSSFDLQEYRNKNIQKKQKNNDNLQIISSSESEVKQQDEPNNRQYLKKENTLFSSLNSNGIPTEKRQIFNLRKSKVEENSKQKPIKYYFNKDSNFSSTSNKLQNPSLRINPQKSPELSSKNLEQKKEQAKKNVIDLQKQKLIKSGIKQPLGKLTLSNFKIKQSNIELAKPASDQNSPKDLIKYPPNGKQNQYHKKQIEEKKEVLRPQNIQIQKKQALGLKQQLKKLGSRPTQKIQLKSIAFTPIFKFKNQLQLKQTQPQTKSQILKQPTQCSMSREAKITQEIPKVNKFISTLREDKPQTQAYTKSHRNSQFSRAMLALMEVQQQSQILRQKVVYSRNTYRQLAILNDDISKRIDQVLRRATKK